MKKSRAIIGSAVLAISLTGCGVNDNAEGNGNNGEQQAQANQTRPRVLQTEPSGDRTLKVNDRAEQHVERLEEVEDAHVIISNNNAYVAVRLATNNDPGNNGQNTGTGANRTGTMGTSNQGNQGNTEGNDGTGQSFMENGTVNQNGDNGMIDGKGDAGNGNEQSRALGNDNNNNNDGNNNNAVGKGNGNTNGTGNTNDQTNKGTATRTNNYSPVSNAFEQKIADQVRKADNKIHRVYVSVNPDLYSTMNTYAKDIRSDRDKDSLFRDFNNTVNNFFGRENE